jgi:hypothetical protein
MSNLGHLGIQPKEQEENAKKLLIGERAGNWLTKAVSSIPDNKVTRGIGTGLKFVDMAINRNPGTRLYNQAENLLINKGAQFAEDKLNIDKRIAGLGIGMMIPGQAGEVKAGKNLLKLGKGSKLLKPKVVKGVKEWNITAPEMPQMKLQLEDWLRKEYADKGKASLIKRQDFGTIIVDAEPRQISQITQFLERGGKLPFPPKVVTKKANAFKRLQNTKPPKEELTTLGKQLGLTQKQINAYFKEAQDGFGDVQEAARREGLTIKQLRQEYITGKKTPRTDYTPGAYHAGHFWPANKGGATSRRTAGIEPGKLNIMKKDSFEGTINVYAAQKAGIPTTWAEDMKMWIRDKKGLPGPRYAVDFSNEQRKIIESIPWDANIDEVEAIWKQHNLDKIPNIEQYKAIERELAPRALQIGGDRR